MQKFPRLGSSIRGFRGGAPRRGGVRKTVWTRIGKEIPAFAGMTVCGTRGQSGCRQAQGP